MFSYINKFVQNGQQRSIQLNILFKDRAYFLLKSFILEIFTFLSSKDILIFLSKGNLLFQKFNNA